jgi:hypothetical protein
MRYLRWLPILAAACVGLTWIAGHAQQTEERPRFVLTEREAFLMFNAELVAAPTVAAAEWSRDGRYILASRIEERPPVRLDQAPSGDVSLVLWTAATRRSQVVWERPWPGARVVTLGWLPDRPVGLAVVAWTQPAGAKPGFPRVLLRIEGARAPARVLAQLEVGEELLISPRQPLAVLHDRMRNTLRVVRANGSVGPVVRLPKPLATQWSGEGDLLLVEWERPAAPGQPPVFRFQVLEPSSGEIRPLATAPVIRPERAAQLPVRLRHSSLTLREENVAQDVRPLWLESVAKSEQPRALLCADGELGQLAPDGRGVFYRSQGALWVVPFLRMAREPFLQARRAAMQKTAVSNARQIGTALMMYLQDYDTVFPPAEAVVDRLMPYCKNRSVFHDPATNASGFVYLYHVAPLSSIKEPANVPVGHLTGPGGRAVIYADGHVVWEDEARSPSQRE